MPGSITREAVGVQLPGSGRRVKLKVGQSVDSSTGEVEENYRRSPEADRKRSRATSRRRAKTAAAPRGKRERRETTEVTAARR